MMIGIEKNGIVISIGIGFGKNRFRKKYRYRFRKFLVSKKVSVSVSENFGIEKSIGFGIEKFWYRKKVSVSVSFRFLVSPLTGGDKLIQLLIMLANSSFMCSFQGQEGGPNAPEALEIKEAAAGSSAQAGLKNGFHKLLPDQQNQLSPENIALSTLLFASALSS